MERLNDIELIETYFKAKELNCSQDFIVLLYKEMQKRSIEKTMFSLLERKTI